MPGTPFLSVAVMAHHSRTGSLPRLRQALGDVPAVVDQASEGAWATARRAWSLLQRSGSAWSVVVQDDAVPCLDFYARVAAQLRACPHPTSLYFGAQRKYLRALAAAGTPAPDTLLLRGASILPTGVALALPTRHIRAMLAHADRLGAPELGAERLTHDDVRVCHWLAAMGMPLAYPVPSLVDHAGEGGSLFPGHSGARRAYRFIDREGAYLGPSGAPDFVYTVGPEGPGAHSDLRYSLRSLANVPHGQVWVIGCPPRWLSGRAHGVPVPLDDHHSPGLPFPRERKWSSILRNLEYACALPEVSDPFVLMNDDFVCMSRQPGVPLTHLGTFAESTRWRKPEKGYTQLLRLTERHLRDVGVSDPLNFEAHRPMPLGKGAFQQVLRDMPHDRLLYRSLSGNLCTPGAGELVRDCKVFPPHVRDDPSGSYARVPDGADWVSFSDAGFTLPAVQRVLRWSFPRPCVYET